MNMLKKLFFLLFFVCSGAQLQAMQFVSNMSPLDQLVVLAYNNDIAAVRALLEQNPTMDLNGRTMLTVSPVGVAVLNGRAEIVELLIRHGARIEDTPDEAENRGLSLLHAALNEYFQDPINDRFKVLQLLLTHGADINRLGDGVTPLNRALVGEYKCKCTLPAEKRASILLLNKGADYRIVDGDGDSGLHIAALIHHMPALEWLRDNGHLTQENLNLRGQKGLTLLHMCARNQYNNDMLTYIACARLLLDCGANPLVTNDGLPSSQNNVTPKELLMHEITKKNESMMLSFLANPASAQVLAPQMESMGKFVMELHGDVWPKPVTAMQAPAPARASSSASSSQPTQATSTHVVKPIVLNWQQKLVEAVEKFDYEAAETLCLYANPNKTDAAGMPLLLKAINKCDGRMVGILMKAGADANAHHQGKSLLQHLYEKYNELFVADELADIKTRKLDGLYASLQHMLLGLDKKQAIKSARSNFVCGPLHDVDIYQDPSARLPILLLNHGWDPTVQDSDGDTAVHVAAYRCNAAFLNRCKELGYLTPELLNKKNKHKNSVMLMSVADALKDEADLARRNDCMKLLLESSGDPEAAAGNGTTVVQCIENEQRRESNASQQAQRLRQDALALFAQAIERKKEKYRVEFPFHAACAEGNSSTARWFRPNAERLADLQNWSEQPNEEKMVKLIKEKAERDVVEKLKDAQDSKGRTLLHCAAAAGKLPVVQGLLSQYNVSLNVRDCDQKTPVQCALAGQHNLVVDELEDAQYKQLPEKIECQICMQEKHRDGIALNSECCQNPAVCYQCVHKTVRQKNKLVCPLCRKGDDDRSPRENGPQCPIS